MEEIKISLDKTKSTKTWNKKRIKVPTILQMEAVECGAAALAMVFAYHGLWIPLEQMRIECGVNRDGSKASNMLKAARKHGADAKGFRSEIYDLGKYELPIIIFWNFNHFVVLTGIKKNKVYINDPASGPRIISKEEFDSGFTGVVLTFTPNKEFSKGGKKPSTLRSLKNRINNTKSVLSFVLLIGLFLVIPGLLVPTFTKVFVDKILVNEMKSWIVPLLTAMTVIAIIRGFLTWLQQYFLLRLETQLSLSNSARFFYHIFRLPIQFFFQRQSGEIGNRVQLNDKVAKLLSEDLTRNMLNVAMIVFYAILMFYYDVALTLIGISIVLINFIVLYFISEKRKIITQNMAQERGKLISTAMNGIELIETLKATGSEDEFFSKWSGYHAKVLNVQQKYGRISRFLAQLPRFLTAINKIVIFGLGGLRVIQGSMTLGMLLAFKWLMESFVTPVEELVNAGSKIQDATGYMRRLDDIYGHKRDQSFDIETPKNYSEDEIVKLQGHVELKNITFGYNELEEPLIKNFSILIKPGERVALVGASGSGKSTIAKLIGGLYPAWDGEILFDGKEREKYSREVLNNSLSIVDQDLFLFGGTIKENISMWDKTIPEADIIRASRDSIIDVDISKRKNGYKGVISERGRNFSGGQRQRLEIARALATNPSILIFDEATSSLDPPTEKLIDDFVRMRGCSLLIIAHRLSTIRDSDEIIVMDRGKILERGTHHELMKIKGEYSNLISSSN